MTDILTGSADDPRPPIMTGPSRLPGKVRPFWRGFGLSVISLGLYHFYWHYATHHEVARQRGRQDPWAWLWFVYVFVFVLQVILTLAIAWPYGLQRVDTSGGPLGIWASLARLGAPVWPLVIGWVLQTVLFLVFVARQFRWLALVREESGLKSPAPAVLGIVVFFFAQLTNLLPPLLRLFIGLPLLMFAYAVLQSAYNEAWQELKAAAPGASGHAIGTTASGRPVVEFPYACPNCGIIDNAVGLPGQRVEVQCAACGARGSIRVGDPMPATAGPMDEPSWNPA